ncbi:hypothetical protein [Rubrobacter calidifluminis]|uniref:hypothetical protein n=1 Tax=Rubrobacter calidifluminis TaxID=1392640 RepID=UPI00235F0EEA|nr:hypothetical protein [Rubrobacter calidifluminis]
MGGGERETGRELESQLEAAGVLIESLEQEVASLRHELAQARVALRAAREGMAARERAPEETVSPPEDEVRRIKSVAETRERELRRALSIRLKEQEEDFRKRLAALAEQREADRRAFLDRLAAQQEKNRREISSLKENLEGMKLRREAELRAYNERLRQLEEENLALKNAIREEPKRHTRNGEAWHEAPLPSRDRAGSPDAAEHEPEAAESAYTLQLAVERFNASEHTLTAAATIKSFGLPEVRIEQKKHDGSVEITISWGELGWKRYTCDPALPAQAEVLLEAEGADPIEIIPNARLDLRGRLMLGEGAR